MTENSANTFNHFSKYHSDGALRWVVQLAFYILLLLLCLITYHGLTDNYPYNDDFLWLSEARNSMEPGNLLTLRVLGFFRPLVNVSFYLMERISPGNISSYYAFNLILHFLNAILVYLLISALFKDRLIAAATAVLFTVTCVHSAGVLWISARTTLLSTFFLLASLVVLSSRSKGKLPRLALSIILYILALASKETAIVGLLLVALVFFLTRKDPRHQFVHRRDLVSFAVVTAMYFVLRMTVMGGFFQANWSPGAHVLRNVVGGFLFQVYPWPVFAFILPSATNIPKSNHPFMPEILIIPLILFLVLLAKDRKRLKAISFAVGWALFSLLPMSLFQYRFFSTASFTQNRYYYLSSVGSVLLITILLAPLWKSRSWTRRIAGAALFVYLCVGYIVLVDKLEKQWDKATGSYKGVVSTVLERSEQDPEISTLAIEDSPLEMRYFEAAVTYKHPDWTVHEVKDGQVIASIRKPFLYATFVLEDRKYVVYMKKIE